MAALSILRRFRPGPIFAMVGNAAYFVFSAENRIGLPPIVLAAGGTTVATLGLKRRARGHRAAAVRINRSANYAGIDVPGGCRSSRSGCSAPACPM